MITNGLWPFAISNSSRKNWVLGSVVVPSPKNWSPRKGAFLISKKEQNKRWIAEQKYKDDQRQVVKELLRLYVAYEIIEMEEDEFDDFIIFLNADPDFLKTAAEMELVLFIKDKFEHFKLIRKR